MRTCMPLTRMPSPSELSVHCGLKSPNALRVQDLYGARDAAATLPALQRPGEAGAADAGRARRAQYGLRCVARHAGGHPGAGATPKHSRSHMHTNASPNQGSSSKAGRRCATGWSTWRLAALPELGDAQPAHPTLVSPLEMADDVGHESHPGRGPRPGCDSWSTSVSICRGRMWQSYQASCPLIRWHRRCALRALKSGITTLLARKCRVSDHGACLRCVWQRHGRRRVGLPRLPFQCGAAHMFQSTCLLSAVCGRRGAIRCPHS